MTSFMNEPLFSFLFQVGAAYRTRKSKTFEDGWSWPELASILFNRCHSIFNNFGVHNFGGNSRRFQTILRQTNGHRCKGKNRMIPFKKLKTNTWLTKNISFEVKNITAHGEGHPYKGETHDVQSNSVITITVITNSQP